jgi:CRISPR-associated endonuclease/helicase Cas3
MSSDKDVEVTTPHQVWAHSPNDNGDWHSLVDHLRGTAELARRFAAPFGGGDVAYWLGMLHDVGKGGDWQRGLCVAALSGDRVGVDHKSLGTRLAYERGLGGFAGAIFGHHGGLIDTTVLVRSVQERIDKYRDVVASAELMLPQLVPDLPADLSGVVPGRWRDPLVGEIAARLCFSALVDADYLDTSAHFAGTGVARVREDADFGLLQKRFERRRTELLAGRRVSPVDGLREALYRDCVRGAAQPRGMFRLPAPTGSGKTLAAGGFALRHAEIHGMRRVVVAVPFLTITEQNAAIYRRLLDDDGPGEDGVVADPVVLEHHSQVDFDDASRAGRWGRLAAENWDAPFVVTTFVRLFESLFGRRPAAMRRLHRLAGAVIVLDEVQALSHEVLVPILDALRVLVAEFGASVLLASATQPDFWALKTLRHVRVIDLVEDPGRLFGALRRVRYEWRVASKPTLAEIADEAAAAGSAMVVVNTTADAKAVYDRWRGRDLDGRVWHLSTRMCPAHRRRVLVAVRGLLAAGERVLLAATQLIEAGVDVDFPVVFRAMAPADSLLQAAGRANREGLLPGLGRVVIFAAVDGGAPPGYRLLVGNTEELFGPGRADPDDRDRLSAYYRAVYRDLNLEDPRHLGQRIQQARRRWQFQTVADGPLTDGGTGRDRKRAFRLIRDDGVAVITWQGAADEDERRGVQRLVERVRSADVPDGRDLRRLQPFITTLHPSVLHRPGVRAMLRPVLGQAPVGAGGLAEWIGPYDPATGIDVDPSVEEFVL